MTQVHTVQGWGSHGSAATSQLLNHWEGPCSATSPAELKDRVSSSICRSMLQALNIASVLSVSNAILNSLIVLIWGAPSPNAVNPQWKTLDFSKESDRSFFFSCYFNTDRTDLLLVSAGVETIDTLAVSNFKIRCPLKPNPVWPQSHPSSCQDTFDNRRDITILSGNTSVNHFKCPW